LALEPGSNFGPYRIMGRLGRGGMATVFRAYEARLDRYVALKVLSGDFLATPGFAERFDREARVIAKLEHPNIIPIYAFDIEGGIPWMSMRLVSGGTLSGILGERKMTEAEVAAIVTAVAGALDYAHGQGVVHRDVKPQNILLDESGQQVYLADFGIAKMVEGATVLTQTGMISGTPQYMAPEQAHAKLDQRSDIYALGVVAYEALTGSVPFSADTPIAVLMKHVTEPMPLPAPGKVAEPMVRALLRALAKDPADRWPSAGAFAAALARGAPAAPTGDVETAETSVLPGVRPAATASTARVPGPTRMTSERPPAPRRPGEATVVRGTEGAQAAPPPRRSLLPWLGLLVAVGLLGVLAVFFRTRPTPEVAQTTPLPTPVAAPVAPPVATPAPVLPPPGAIAPTPTPLATPSRPKAAPSPAPRVAPPAAAPRRESPVPEPIPPPREPAPPPAAPLVPAVVTGPVGGSSAAPPMPVAPSSGPGGPRTTAAPARPARYPFAFDEVVALHEPGAGPVTLRELQMSASNGYLVAEVELTSTADGNVEVRVDVLDEAGSRLVTLKGRKRIRAGKTEVVEAEERAPDAIIESARYFRVQAQAY
jgi:serine/threonine-protein kinase